MDEEEDLDLAAEDGDEQDDPEAPEVDEATAALIAKARAEERSKVEAEFDGHKKNLNRRFNTTIEDLRGQGYDLADDGKVLVRDPQRAAAAFKENVVPLALGHAPAQVEEVITLDPYDTPEELTRKANLIADRRIAAREAEHEKRYQALESRLDEMQGLVGQQSEGATEEVARTALAKLGMDALADDPSFAEEYREAVQEGVKKFGPQALRNKVFLNAVVGQIAFNLPDDVLQKAREARTEHPSGPTPQQRINQAVRNGTGALGPTRGMGAADYAQDDLNGAQILGISVQEYRNLDGDATVFDTLERRKKNGAGRR